MRANPRQVARFIIRFWGFVGPYVWHCHILEFVNNETIRSLEVDRGDFFTRLCEWFRRW